MSATPPAGVQAGDADSDHALVERYDAVVFDLDGVLHRGDRVLPSAQRVLEKVRARGAPVAFLTNNSARTPEEVARRLSGMGLDVRPGEVLTSAVATAAMLDEQGARGAAAFVVGEDGVREALRSVGIGIVEGEPTHADLVVVGLDRSADYQRLRTASLLVERGARLVATNGDGSFPAADGLWPGAGALLAAIVTTTGATPIVVGKPARPMFDAVTRMTGAARPLMVGDRLDTDISGAAGAGWDSLLVLTGASTAADLPEATDLPTYVAQDVGAVLEPRTRVRFEIAAASDRGRVAQLLAATGLEDVDGSELGNATRTVIGSDLEADDGTGPFAATASLTETSAGNYLRAVAVRPDLQGQGLGMLAAAIALRVGDPGRPAFLMTETAPSFFAALGFEKVSAEDLPTDIVGVADRQGCSASATAMRRLPRKAPAGGAS